MIRLRRNADLATLPAAIVEDRESTLRRVLSDFPEPLLAALITGIETHGDNLCWGRLYTSHESGCAVGAMIRELNPDDFAVGRMRFLIRHRWRRRAASYGGDLATGMHASLLEAIFDRAVMLTLVHFPEVTGKAASRAVGRWLLGEANRELGLRYERIEAGLPAMSSWRDLPLRRWGENMEARMGELAHGELVAA